MIKAKYINYWIVGLLIIIGFHLYVLSQLIFFPYPELFVYSYLTDQGLLPYKQIFDQHFPGLMFFPINLHTLGMTTPQAARFWQYALVSATHILLFLVGRRLFKSEKWALFTNFLYLIWQPFFEGYVLWIDSFVPIFLLGAFYFLQRSFNKPKSLFWTGFLLGVVLLFKQVTLPLIVVLGLLIWLRTKKISKVVPYFAGIAVPVIFLIIYILSIGVWQDFIYWTFTFNLTTFAQMGRKYPDLVGLARAMPVFGLAFISLFVFYIRTKARELNWLGAFFLGSLFFAYARFDYIHLQPALAFALLILVFVFRLIPKRLIQPIYLGFIVLSIFLLIPFFRLHKGDRTLFFGEFERKVSVRVTDLIKPGEKVFAFGTMPHIYQMTNTLPPGNIFVFQFPWFMRVAEERVLSGIINDPPKVVVRDKSATVGGIRLVDYMSNIDNYIEERYEVSETVNGTEILLKQ